MDFPVLIFTDVSGHCWIVFGQARATVMRATRNGVSPTTNYVTVVWRNPDNVTHRQLLSIDQVWRRSTALTWSRWGCRRLADNIWLLARANNNNRGGCISPHPDARPAILVCKQLLTVLLPSWVHLIYRTLSSLRLSLVLALHGPGITLAVQDLCVFMPPPPWRRH